MLRIPGLDISGIFAQHAAALDAASSGLTKAERKSLISLLKKLGITAEGILGSDRNRGP